MSGGLGTVGTHTATIDYQGLADKQTMSHSTHISRLAPSPTGALHLGNAYAFLVNWALAQQNGWGLVLRIDDLDGPRTKKGADELAIKDLEWLGLDWTGLPYYQSENLPGYASALDQLKSNEMIYPCTCSRKQIEQVQAAPHGNEHELRYPGTCRPLSTSGFLPPPADKSIAWRLVVSEQPVEFDDQVHGHQVINIQKEVGDFVVSTKEGLPAYQLAVVVDDFKQKVSHIVRGDDLLPSTGRQILIYRMLGLSPLPHYYHLPIVCGPDGRRLAKRHGDSRVAFYREKGISPFRVVGLIAFWCRITEQRQLMSASEFAGQFRLELVPHNRITFTYEDEQWLCG